MRALMLSLCLMLAGGAHAEEEKMKVERFGTVTIYRKTPHPARVVLFVSGDGGWNTGVVDMARELSALDSLVVGIDIIQYLKSLSASNERCTYAAADFERLSQYVQKKLGRPDYQHPILVGYSSGATLVYALLVQAPAGTFLGAISMGFCPDLPLTKPFCRGSGLEWKPGPKGKGCSFLPAPGLRPPWVAFQGTIDQVCNAQEVQRYVGQVGHGHLVLLPKVGHGFSVPRNWLPQFKEAFTSLIENEEPVRKPVAPEVQDLPLVEVPGRTPQSNLFAIMVSGDGGWAGIDRELAGALAAEGIPVAGLSSLQYFWKKRTPEEASADLARVLRHYLVTWEKSKAILVGYSLGADVLPFMCDRLPEDLRSKISLIALLGPSSAVEFEFHLTDWLGEIARGDELQVLPEVMKLKGSRVLCIYGEDEDEPLCRRLDSGLAHVVALKGGHHFGGDYQSLARLILKDAR